MKLPNWIPGVLMVGVLAFSGCGKSDKSAVATSTVQVLDATKFRPAFESASPEIKAIVNKVMLSIQGSNYDEALAGLDKLAALPDLSDAQKKVVADLSDQLKKKMAAQ
jgi:hypothetical protein